MLYLFDVKYIWAQLLFILIGAFSLSSFSTELSPRTTLRDRINAKVTAESCKNKLGGQNLTRGITRGGIATRGPVAPTFRSGIRSEAPELPEKAQAFSDRFAQVIQAEFGLPYGFEHDPNSIYFFTHDPYEGSAKLGVYKELGYEWNGADEPSRSPRWIESARNFQKLVKTLGIDPAKMWRASLVLYRNVGVSIDAKTGKEIDKMEYLFVDPLTETFPNDMSSWSMLTKDVQFNIPFTAIFEAMKQGKFPMLDANHDTNHFIAGIRFPELTASIIEMIQKATPETISLGFKRRQYWLTEALSLPDPKSETQNLQFLKSQRRGLKLQTVAEIEASLSQMKESELLQYSLDLARYFESQLRDVSGGNSNAAEKWFYLSESFGMTAKDLINEDLRAAERLDRIAELSKTYFENGPITLNANPKIMTNETATFNFNTFVTSQKLLTLLMLQNKSGPVSQTGWTQKTAKENLIKYMSRIEYILRQPIPTYRQWAEGFLQAELPMSNPVAQMLLEVFGNDIVKNFYLGIGIRRNE